MAQVDEFNACLNSRGLYNSLQFVLRLSPEIHRRLANIPPDGLVVGADTETIKALGVHLHETAHWWQHIGSTTGLMLSLVPPAQAHVNYSHLKFLLQNVGPQKSILRWLEGTEENGGPDSPVGHANRVVNNFHDIDFFRRLITSPRSAPDFIGDRFFESIGHSFSIAYGNICSLLSHTFGQPSGIFPDPRQWEAEFESLRRDKVEGFVRGGKLQLSPIGACQILEGQARFMQLQFLHFAEPGRWNWEMAREHGMLSGVYVEAFETFLSLTGFKWPSSIDHGITAMFLLVCDLSINPGPAFPLDLRFPKAFVTDVDPGMRFLFLCRAVARTYPGPSQPIRDYSKQEYEAVTETLTAALYLDSPAAIVRAVASWPERAPAIGELMAGHEGCKYDPMNLAVRLLLAHFVSFARDKMARPELFCWPGAWMAGERVTADIATVVDRQAAPFIDKIDGDGVYPRLRRGRDEVVAHETFTAFYAINVTYDLSRQWIVRPGPFQYDYQWLADATVSEMKGFGDRHFEMAYGVHPDRFRLL